MMPFAEDFGDVYTIAIKDACDNAGAYCERLDEQIFHESMLDRIYNQIDKADILIADMTGRNANVFYEVGYAHALGKHVILITKSADDIPFDLKHHAHIVYGNSLATLRQDLEKRVSWHIENPSKESPNLLENLELMINNQLYLPGKILEVEFPKSQYPHVHLDFIFHNSVSKRISQLSITPTLLFDQTLAISNDKGYDVMLLPEERCYLQRKEPLLLDPGGRVANTIDFFIRRESTTDTAFRLLLQILTEGAPIDFPFEFSFE